MTYTLRFLTEVEDDAITAYMCPEVYDKFRRSLVRRFPYAIYYRVKKNEIIIGGVFHCARNPQTIRNKLRDRDKP